MSEGSAHGQTKFKTPHPKGHVRKTTECVSLTFRRDAHGRGIGLGAFGVSSKLCDCTKSFRVCIWTKRRAVRGLRPRGL